jgi:NADPH-dependent 2,4-dienoyl-CoA reductase/sulfur reductase-like enzyme
MKVCVVGAGTAGASAAVEAARIGAEVAIYESAERVPTRRSSWPSILSGGRASRFLDEQALARGGVQVNLGENVLRAESKALVLRGATRAFDSLVLATGCAPVKEPLPGASKRGVHVLETESSFQDLRERMDGYTSVAILGSGLAAAAVADRLSESGAKVAILARSGLLSSQLSQGPRSLVLRSARERGVRLLDSSPDKVVGVERVEAVISSGTVIPCDALVVVPGLHPSLPSNGFSMGRGGGVVVNEFMASSSGVFAAGDCAEVAVGSSAVPMPFESSASAMGRIAGANSAGARLAARITSSYSGDLFGVGVCKAGLTLEEASACGLGAREFSRLWDGELACSLVVEVGSLVLLGAQLGGRGARRLAEFVSLAVSSRSGLRELAYLESPGSTDISPVAETATEALTNLAISGKGPGLRPR